MGACKLALGLEAGRSKRGYEGRYWQARLFRRERESEGCDWGEVRSGPMVSVIGVRVRLMRVCLCWQFFAVIGSGLNRGHLLVRLAREVLREDMSRLIEEVA